jgi:glycosyltransferase involved in cell wall biosynthesis
VAESYPPVYGGGAAIAVHDVCHALAGRGHDVRVLSTEQREDAPYTVRQEDDGPIRVRRVNLPYFRSRDPDGWQLGLRRWRAHERRVAALIDAEVEDWRPDLVSYSATRPLGEQGLISTRHHGLPIVGWLHEAWEICPRIMLLRSPLSEPCSGPGPAKCLECMCSQYDGTHMRAALKFPWRIPRHGPYFLYRIRRRALARSQLIGALAYSEWMVTTHRPHIRGPVLNVPIGVNLERLPVTLPERPRQPLRFGFMGGFQPNKGIWDVLDAATALKHDGLEFELHIWGPGQDKGRNQIGRRDLQDQVVLRGMYQEDEIWGAYEAIDVAIIATTVPEPFGRIPIEAAAAGAPTIGAKVGGIAESIRHEVNGLLYRFRDGADLAGQMRRVLVEPGLYRTLCEGLEPPVDTRNQGAAFEAAYRSLIEQGGTGQARAIE